MSDILSHKSVLLHESIYALNIRNTGRYIDGTFGMGGHSKLILSKLAKSGSLLSIDKDYKAVEIGKKISRKDNRLIIIHGKFSKIYQYMCDMGYVGAVDGILLDLGICSFQLHDVNRGFSFLSDGLLDMRMDVSTGQSAAEWLARASQNEIVWVLKTFGEEKYAKSIAKTIVIERKKQPILNSLVLSQLISRVIMSHRCYFMHKHFATRSFLAIRMYINQELKELEKVLQDSWYILSPKGRLVVISFNSLEDRLVKNFIRQNSCILSSIPKRVPFSYNEILEKYQYKCLFKNLGKLFPTIQEIKMNPHARSAILRCVEKLPANI